MSKKKKTPNQQKTVLNRRASFDYELKEDIVTGIVLTGPEVRAARDGHVHLKGAFITIRDNELWLNNASFSLKLNQKGGAEKTIDTRSRKLLANRKQIAKLISERIAGMNIVPTKMLTSGRFIKVIIATGKGKKKYDKRETLKRREQERDAKRAMKRY